MLRRFAPRICPQSRLIPIFLGVALSLIVVGDASAGRKYAQLTARPGQPTEQPVPGLHDLGLAKRRDGFVYVPGTYDPAHPAPLLVLLHGAGGTAKRGWIPYTKMAEPRGIILLAIDSRSHRTWDGILDAWGPDVAFIDEALAQTFARYRVDATRVALAGFSDGASYALSLGAANGVLFTHVVAFAPGSIRPVMTRGRPRIFISHGRNDPILSFRRTRDGIVPTLRRAGYDVTFHETDSNHEVSWDTSLQMLDWFLAR